VAHFRLALSAPLVSICVSEMDRVFLSISRVFRESGACMKSDRFMRGPPVDATIESSASSPRTEDKRGGHARSLTERDAL